MCLLLHIATNDNRNMVIQPLYEAPFIAMECDLQNPSGYFKYLQESREGMECCYIDIFKYKYK